ncbi:MAG: DUF3147 family protein [Solirubrobacterales bacterium]|nr:DUF3147 family protein [Solirubrobacterales bacterium]
MSTETQELKITDRVEQRPRFSMDNVRETTPRELIIRFVAGAATSAASGAVTLIFGARVGGVLLGFPAIMAASLTLIAEEEDKHMAREDARGGIVGACALALFAAVAALTFGHLPGGVVLALSAVVWAVIAVLLYAILWYR